MFGNHTTIVQQLPSNESGDDRIPGFFVKSGKGSKHFCFEPVVSVEQFERCGHRGLLVAAGAWAHSSSSATELTTAWAPPLSLLKRALTFASISALISGCSSR